MSFWGELGGGARGADRLDATVCLGNSSYSAVQSGIYISYRQCDIERPAHMMEGASLYFKVSNRKVIKLVQDIGMKMAERKNPMTLQVYKYLVKTFFKSDKKEHTFAYLFLVLDW